MPALFLVFSLTLGMSCDYDHYTTDYHDNSNDHLLAYHPCSLCSKRS